MSTMMDERTDERLHVTDDGDHDTFAHYVKKSDFDKALFDGIAITALCGKKWLPTKDFTKFPVCPECKEIWDGFEPGDDE